MSGLIKYPEQRAVEDTAFGQGLTPTRLCRLLLPVWRADVQATIRDSEPYDLIDRYLEAAIARGKLGNVREIADFYGLDMAVTGNAARFLEAIGHLSADDKGRLELTPIGLRSVQEGKRYTQTVADRRHLYFDGFTCRPLTRPYYDDQAVTFVEGTQLAGVLADTGRDAFTAVVQIQRTGFGPEALEALEQMPAAERDRFNLPEQVISPALKAAEQVYLPAYVVRAIGRGGAVRYLAYTQPMQEADPDWSQVCTASADIAAVVDNEYDLGKDDDGQENAARRWVGRRFTGRFDVGWRDGVLVATLPAAAFSGTGGLEPRRIGSFMKMDGWYFRLWCDDDSLRDRALLDLTETFLRPGTKATVDETIKRLAKFCRQVALDPMSAAECAHLARDAGRKALADQLDTMAELSPSPSPDRVAGIFR